MAHAGVYVSLLIAAFNLLPIPPLDGSSILARFLPESLAERFLSLGRYGILLVLGLLFLGNLVGFSILGTLLFPLVEKGAALLGVSPMF
jgi:Zn-dependent protease